MKKIFVVVLAVVLTLTGCSKGYVAKTDLQYMYADWNESWHTLTTDTTFENGKEFFLNIDMAVSANRVTTGEVEASISFIAPMIMDGDKGIFKTEGPQGTWIKDNIGTYTYSFKVPVSRLSKDKDGKPVYTNLQHLQFKIKPNNVGSQKILIKYNSPVNSSYNKEISFSVNGENAPEKYVKSNIAKFTYVNTGLELKKAAKLPNILFGFTDNQPTLYFASWNQKDLLCDDIEPDKFKVVFNVKATDSFSGEVQVIETLKSTCYFTNSTDRFYLKDAKVIEKLLNALKNGSRVDFEISHRKSDIVVKETFDYNPEQLADVILRLRDKDAYRDIKL